MIKRKTSGSIVCPSCGRLISADAPECIHCGRKNPGLWGYGPFLSKLLANLGTVSQRITAVCVVLYVLSLLLDPGAIFRNIGFFNLFSPSGAALDKLGMTGSYALAQGRWWTLVTAIYLHGGLLHILFNMLWLRSLGMYMEQLYGASRTFLIFTFSGVLGYFLSAVFGIPFTIGASGSIFGLLGALVYYGRRRGGFFGAQVYQQVLSWAVVLFLFGFMMPGVNNIAHAGGFAGGYLSAWLLGFHELKFETKNHRLLALAVSIGTALCFVIELFIA